MGMKAANNAFGILATGITDSATTITLGTNQGLRFPVLGEGDWTWGTLSNAANVLEVVKVTARVGDTFTVVRNTTAAYAYAAGDRLDLRPVAEAVNDKMDAAVAEASYAKLAGGNNFAGVQNMEAQRFTVLALGNVSGTKNIDLSKAGTYTATVIGDTTFTFTNAPPAGKDQTVYLKVKNGAAFQTKFAAGTQYPNGGTAPIFSVAGKDLVAIWYDTEESAYVVGVVWRNIK